MEKNRVLSCADCSVMNCDLQNGSYPAFCLTERLSAEDVDSALKKYAGKDYELMMAAAEVEYEGYGKNSRVAETIELAKKLGAKKIGIASCVGLLRETGILAKVLRSHGFDVYGVACKVGATEKVRIGIPEEHASIGKNMCNPILQADILNREETELNIVMGLCVGHDSLFYKHSNAIVTTLVVKDRVLGHNPAAALYTHHSYYNKLSQK